MSCKETDFEIEPGSERVVKRRKLEDSSSLGCREVDHGDFKSIEESGDDDDRESLCVSALLMLRDAVSCIREEGVIPDVSRSDESISGSGDDGLTVVDTVKCISQVEGNGGGQVDGGGEIISSVDQSSCFVFEQMHSESPSTNDPSKQILEWKKRETIMKDGNDSEANFVETKEDGKEETPQIFMGIDVKRKLLVLDINGLLADVVSISFVSDDYKADIVIGMKAVFKRPHCDDFLQFCFERFNVGIWSSRTKRNVDSILELLLGEHRSKLVFCWDQSHCTLTGFNTIDNQKKPLVLKELKKLWEKDDPSLPWNFGDYDESNTILLDDSPYKGLKNPPNTAIFPDTYQYKNLKDDSLGPKGDLRAYLEGLSLAPNVQKYVEHNSYGQRPITESNASWSFYAKVIGLDSTKQEESSCHSQIQNENASTTVWSLEKTVKDQSFIKDIDSTKYFEQHSNWDKLTVGRNTNLTACSSYSKWDKLKVDQNLESIVCSSNGLNIRLEEKASSYTLGHNPHTQSNERNTQSTTKDAVHLSSKTNQQWNVRASTSTVARSPWIQRSVLGRNREVFHKKKLLILDVNGLLGDFVSYEPYNFKAHSMLGDKAVFKRPYCNDFLNFCFEKFHIGFWMTTSRKNAQANLDLFLGRDAKNVLFSWDISHCLKTNSCTLERTRPSDRPIFLKELRKVWEKDEPNLPWGQYEFNQSNTLLVDNFPHSALLNPPHTAIFPPRYRFMDESTDNTLGPESDLRVFLEEIAVAENVQEYVRNKPYGQSPISDEHPSWNYYVRVIEDTKARQKPWLEKWWEPTNEHRNEQSFKHSIEDTKARQKPWLEKWWEPTNEHRNEQSFKHSSLDQKPWLEKWWTPTNEHRNEQSFKHSSLDKLKVDQNVLLTECSSIITFENSRSILEDENAISDTHGPNPTTQTDEQKTQSETKDPVHLSFSKDQQDCSADCVTVVTSREPPTPWIPHSSLGNSREVARKMKLLILDVNGLLADFVSHYDSNKFTADSFLSNKAVFKRPYCDDFLNFCFDNFHIGFWLTTSRRNTLSNLNLFLGRATKDVLFSWDISNCFETGFNAVERRDRPILFKELRRVWENNEQFLSRGRCKFDQSNTLLVDNYPCTALLNPPHTAIFPPRYWYKNEETDDSLGPGGDLRVFLEGLVLADNVQDYVKHNPFGQTPISDEIPTWNYYAKVIEDAKARQKPWLERWWDPRNDHKVIEDTKARQKPWLERWWDPRNDHDRTC